MTEKTSRVSNPKTAILIRYLAERKEIKCTLAKGKRFWVITFEVPEHKLHRFEVLRNEIKKELKNLKHTPHATIN